MENPNSKEKKKTVEASRLPARRWLEIQLICQQYNGNQREIESCLYRVTLTFSAGKPLFNNEGKRHS